MINVSSKKLKICIVGDFSKNLDEGEKNVAYHINQELANSHTIIQINEKNLMSFQFLKTIFTNTKPDIIHYFTDPTIKSLLFLKLLSIIWGNPKTVVSALHPDISLRFRRWSFLYKPTILLVQSKFYSNYFHSFSFSTAFLPNGVDILKFVPIDSEKKFHLRRKFGFHSEKFIVFHVGHVKLNRHLEIFEKIQSDKVQGVIVASDYFTENDIIVERLKNSGCILKYGYVDNIEEFFAIADCYLFPAETEGAIEIPLSVLEAMACNLPVVTRKFSALEDLFKEGKGFFFAETDEEFIEIIETISRGISVNTRDLILDYSWENVTKQLIGIYIGLLKTSGSQYDA